MSWISMTLPRVTLRRVTLRRAALRRGTLLPVLAGQLIQLVVYQDADDDPSAGTELLLAFYESIQAADGETFSVYELPEPLVVSGSDNVLIGVVNRFVQSGVSPSSRPAAFDTGASEGRSWLTVWSGDPPAADHRAIAVRSRPFKLPGFEETPCSIHVDGSSQVPDVSMWRRRRTPNELA